MADKTRGTWSLMTVLLAKYYEDDQVKEVEMDRTYSMEERAGLLQENREEINHHGCL